MKIRTTGLRLGMQNCNIQEKGFYFKGQLMFLWKAGRLVIFQGEKSL